MYPKFWRKFWNFCLTLALNTLIYCTVVRSMQTIMCGHNPAMLSWITIWQIFPAPPAPPPPQPVVETLWGGPDGAERFDNNTITDTWGPNKSVAYYTLHSTTKWPNLCNSSGGIRELSLLFPLLQHFCIKPNLYRHTSPSLNMYTVQYITG